MQLRVRLAKFILPEDQKQVLEAATVGIKQSKQIGTNDPVKLEGFEFHPHRESIAWFKDEIGRAREVWCLWQVGGMAKDNDVLGIRSIKKLILLDPTMSILLVIEVLCIVVWVTTSI